MARTFVSSSGVDACLGPEDAALELGLLLLLFPIQRLRCCCCCCCSGMLALAFQGDPFGLLFMISWVAQRVTSPEPLGNGMPEIAWENHIEIGGGRKRGMAHGSEGFIPYSSTHTNL